MILRSYRRVFQANILLKLFNTLGHGFVRYVDVAVYGGFDAAVTQQFL